MKVKAIAVRAARRAAPLYWRVVKPRTLGARVLASCGEEVLLVRPTGSVAFYLPGGLVGRRESFEQAARREVKEELGLALGDLALFGVYQNTAEGKRDTVVVFRATLSSHDVDFVFEDGEIAEAGWFPVESLPSSTSPATRRRIDELLHATTPAARSW